MAGMPQEIHGQMQGFRRDPWGYTGNGHKNNGYDNGNEKSDDNGNNDHIFNNDINCNNDNNGDGGNKVHNGK